MAQLGVRRLDDLVGRADLLELDPSALHDKNRGLDLSSLLVSSAQVNDRAGSKKAQEQDHQLEVIRYE